MFGHTLFSVEIDEEISNINYGIHVQLKNLSTYSIHITQF
jgi:hypothetical protein